MNGYWLILAIQLNKSRVLNAVKWLYEAISWILVGRDVPDG